MNLSTCPHCGKPVKPTVGRSLPQHRRLFGVIGKAFENWPERCDFQPDSAEHLRAWLICKAGWREATTIHLGDATDVDFTARAIEMSFRAAKADGVHCFVVPIRNAVAIVRPKSVAWAKMPHREFVMLSNAIDDVLKSIGLDPEQLSKEASREQPVCASGAIEAQPEAASGSVPRKGRDLPRLQEEAAAG